MCMSVFACVYLYVPSVCLVSQRLEQVSDPQNCSDSCEPPYRCSESNLTQCFCKSSKCSYHEAISPAPAGFLVLIFVFKLCHPKNKTETKSESFVTLSLLRLSLHVSSQVVSSHGNVYLPPRLWDSHEWRYVCVLYTRVDRHTHVFEELLLLTLLPASSFAHLISLIAYTSAVMLFAML